MICDIVRGIYHKSKLIIINHKVFFFSFAPYISEAYQKNKSKQSNYPPINTVDTTTMEFDPMLTFQMLCKTQKWLTWMYWRYTLDPLLISRELLKIIGIYVTLTLLKNCLLCCFSTAEWMRLIVYYARIIKLPSRLTLERGHEECWKTHTVGTVYSEFIWTHKTKWKKHKALEDTCQTIDVIGN